MLAIQVRLLHGTIRAASPEDLGLTGAEDDPGEWPPSPSRLFSALVAGDGTRDRMTRTTGEELRLLEEAQAPSIIAAPGEQVFSNPLQGRYVVAPGTANHTMQEYPGRVGTLVRPSTRLAPKSPVVTYLWADVTPSSEQLSALRFRAARVGYLGCSDSPVQLQVTTGTDLDAPVAEQWAPDPDGDVDLGVPFPGLMDILDALYDESLIRPTRRNEFPTQLCTYRDPAVPRPAEAAWPHVVWLNFGGSLPGRFSLRIAETLKQAILEKYQQHVAGPDEELPAVLHGHHEDGARGYQDVQWLALPFVGHRHADGGVRGAAIMAHRSVEPAVVAGIRQAAWHLRELGIPGVGTVGVELRGERGRPWSTTPGRWTRPARRWTSALPIVHERRLKRPPTEEDVAVWCQHAGYPAPIRVWNSPVPILKGSPSLRPQEVFRDRSGIRRPYSYLTLEFDEEVLGPVVLGRARQFGMGLMAPMGEGRG